ncbi:n-acetylglutamate synthase [Neobacillus endophyticus]|uniref:n-acetylglutamate synthase n=1 Tax=Neobacillus endophyticus TaxID=2738405 RepID=UPI001C27523F|nr:n-acetylglutamate synthase [Neobacillus endophyticus]
MTIVFASIENTANGEVSLKTTFQYKQEGNMITATYSGGSIVKGFLIGMAKEDGYLEFKYNHVNTNNKIRGECVSTPEVLGDGQIRLYEKWIWIDAEGSEGNSIIEEV